MIYNQIFGIEIAARPSQELKAINGIKVLIDKNNSKLVGVNGYSKIFKEIIKEDKKYILDKIAGEYYLVDEKAELREGLAYDKALKEIRKIDFIDLENKYASCDSHDAGSSVAPVCCHVSLEDLVMITNPVEKL